MDLLFCLEDIVSDFRHLFNSQNFALFKMFILGLIGNGGPQTLTQIYQSSGAKQRYWSFPKFLSRGKWNPDAVVRLSAEMDTTSLPEVGLCLRSDACSENRCLAIWVAFFPQLQLSRTSRESIEVSLRT